MELIAKSDKESLMYKIGDDQNGDIIIVAQELINKSDINKYKSMYLNIYMKFSTDKWTFIDPIEIK
jgi:hypothetical protein